MSSKQFYPSGVFLNTPEFRNLKSAPPTIEEWFKEWKTAVQAGNLKEIMSLLHWGLQLLQFSGKQDDIIDMLCHYLLVADGHNSPKNFTGSDYKQATIFGNMSQQEVLRMLADKAWTELCNRAFVLSNEGYGDSMKFESYFLVPRLAEEFIRFIDPERWYNGTYWHSNQANLDSHSKSAYDAKAIAFARHFLGRAWNCRPVLERWIGVEFRELSEEERSGLDNQIKFFHKLKPTIAKLMVRYGMTSHLHDSPLNRPTRRVLWEIIQRGLSWRAERANIQKVDLAQVYGELTLKGYPANSHREVIRVLQLYPLLVAGRKVHIRSKNEKKAAEKDAAIAEAERKFAEAAAALQQLK